MSGMLMKFKAGDVIRHKLETKAMFISNTWIILNPGDDRYLIASTPDNLFYKKSGYIDATEADSDYEVVK
jgi:hypothetical protein